jgi:SAM-dependent methyltransferase
LDLGCGPGELLEYLPADVSYLGVDISPEYVERARQRHGSRARFELADATRFEAERGRFDLVLAFGVLHHLDDNQARAMLAGAARALAPSGRAIAVDPALADGQKRAARMIIRRDRGHHVRDADHYARLAMPSFSRVHAVIRHDLLRIPYTHCILECTAAAAPAR